MAAVLSKASSILKYWGKARGKCCLHVHFPKTHQAPWSVVSMSAACYVDLPCPDTYLFLPWPREEVKTEFNEKTTMIRHSPRQISVLTMPVGTWMAPFTPGFFSTVQHALLALLHASFPPSNQVPPGSSAEHPIINLLQVQNILPNMKSHGSVDHSPTASHCEDAVKMDLRTVGRAGCSAALTWGTQSGGLHHGSPLDFPLSSLFVENTYRNKTWIL